MVDDYQKRKQERRDYYNNHVRGWKLRDCIACNGSGYYDTNNSPKCGSCEGTGKEKYMPVENTNDDN